MAGSYCPYFCIYLFLNKMEVSRKSTWKSGRVSKWKPHGCVCLGHLEPACCSDVNCVCAHWLLCVCPLHRWGTIPEWDIGEDREVSISRLFRATGEKHDNSILDVILLGMRPSMEYRRGVMEGLGDAGGTGSSSGQEQRSLGWSAVSRSVAV